MNLPDTNERHERCTETRHEQSRAEQLRSDRVVVGCANDVTYEIGRGQAASETEQYVLEKQIRGINLSKYVTKMLMFMS